ncbi:VOC family protein [Oricola sp.]|uniref:VOC family protein n=1 Tax=Oricola sp. TaxID=1979950 RepID=UPI00320BEDDF|nr:VOC family protein [Oricola sp.]
MNFVSIRIITDDIKRLVDFYARVTRNEPAWLGEDFAEIATISCTLAIGSTRTLQMFEAGDTRPGANRSAIIEFLVDDVDAEYARLQPFLKEVVQEPKTLPWGNRSLLFRDPDGALVNLFTPVSADAMRKFGR